MKILEKNNLRRDRKISVEAPLIAKAQPGHFIILFIKKTGSDPVNHCRLWTGRGQCLGLSRRVKSTQEINQMEKGDSFWTSSVP